MDSPKAAPIELTPEELAEMRKAARRAKVAANRKAQAAQREGTATYAQRQSQARARAKKREEAVKEIEDRRQGRAEVMRRCVELYAQGMPKSKIAVQLNRNPNTIAFWLKDVPKPMVEEKEDPIQKALAKVTGEVTTAIADEFLVARDEEEAALMANAQAQNTPADQYQAYIAAQAIRLLRDDFNLIRGPRTIRELSELDQLIRRNLGLGANGKSGSGLQIDISILNNTKATPRNGVAVTLNAEEVGL